MISAGNNLKTFMEKFKAIIDSDNLKNLEVLEIGMNYKNKINFVLLKELQECCLKHQFKNLIQFIVFEPV